MECLKSKLTEYGIIANEKQRKANAKMYLEHRLKVSIFWSAILFASAFYIGTRWNCLGSFPIFRGGLWLGFLGLTIRSWSYLNQEESPFPPYILTYPIIIALGCPFITAAAIRAASSHQFLIPALIAAPCFILGYGPMDSLGKLK